MAAKRPKGAKKLIMGAQEILLLTLRPHPLSFLKYYSVGVILLIWTGVVFWLDYQDWLEFDFWSDDLNHLVPALLIAGGATLFGGLLVRSFGRGFQVVFWAAVIALLVLASLLIWYWENAGFAKNFAFLYGVAIGIVGILFADFYRHAFKYYVTNQRVVITYRLLSVEETNMRFEKIEDFEVVRPFIWRLANLGTIRPYTGTEDAKADSDRSFHGPKEALYGIRKPNDVKRQLIEIILERDQWDKQVVDILQQQAEAPAQPATPPPEPEPAPAPEPKPKVAYYQPAPPPEAKPAPAPVRNYERIEPSQYAAPSREEPPPPPDEEEDPEPPSPVRRMYPEAKELDTPLEMEDTRSMDFERTKRARGGEEDPGIQESPAEEESWRRRDDRKPRSL